MKDVELIVSTGKKFGIDEALVIYTSKIIIGDNIKLRCKFGCKHYSKNYSCPPHTYTLERFKKILREYKKAVLLIGKADNDKKKSEFRKGVLKIEEELRKNKYYKATSFIAGPCNLCETCTLQLAKSCIEPDSKRASLEGCGVDIIETIKKFKKNFNIYEREKMFNSIAIILLE